MASLKHYLLVVFVVSLPSLGAHAVDLFVDKDDPLCSDGTGTPFCTISGAVASANDNDRVLIGEGTYNESLVVIVPITIRGAGAGSTIVDGGNSVTFGLHTDVTLEALTITGAGNRGVESSEDSRIVDCEVTGNSARGGGGIYQVGGQLEVLRTVVSNNTSNAGAPSFAGGAGIWTQNGDLTVIDSQIVDNHNLNFGSPGGGLKFDGGDAMLTGTTFALNSAQNNGGAIISVGTSMTLVDCAVYDNSAVGSPGGIGVFGTNLTMINTTVSGNQSDFTAGVSYTGDTFTMRNVTIFGNESTSSSFSAGLFSSTDAAISNSILAGNTNALGGADCSGDLASEGHNLIQASQCTISGDTTGNLIGVDAALAPLADNGGLTMTHAPRLDSPVRDAGDPASPGSIPSSCPQTDQRGVARPLDGTGDGLARCDIGAHEADEVLLIDGFESGDTNGWSATFG